MLQVKELKKKFGKEEVIKGISFDVKKGEAFGLLGPNGAGKSTIIAMICGLLPLDGGEIWVDGLPHSQNLRQIIERIGIVPQDIALYPTMSAKDNLLFWGKMYGLSGTTAKKRADEVLQVLGLKDRSHDKVETFSGGMKRRVNIGAALMHHPVLLIMDEPTVGIDPQSRNHILETVKNLNQEGMTIIYTSHYMEEVEFLCERIGIIDHGQVIALGTKQDLTNRIAGGTVIELLLQDVSNSNGFIEEVQQQDLVEKVVVHTEVNKLEIFVRESNQILGQVISMAIKQDLAVLSVDVKGPNLETLFLQLTGRTLRD